MKLTPNNYTEILLKAAPSTHSQIITAISDNNTKHNRRSGFQKKGFCGH
jgi:hypothetical protein